MLLEKKTQWPGTGEETCGSPGGEEGERGGQSPVKVALEEGMETGGGSAEKQESKRGRVSRAPAH